MRAITADVEPFRIAAAPAVRTLPDRGVVGMVSFIIAESAIFTIFVVAYLFFFGKREVGQLLAAINVGVGVSSRKVL